jgi:multidrug transporter EmrE-like cation transporter
MKPYLCLLLAILCEVIGTGALKESAGFTRVIPTLIVIVAYLAAFILFSVSLRHIPVGIAYAIWSGLGTVGTVLIGIFLWDEQLNISQFAGIFLILTGSLMLNLTEDFVG